MGCLVFTLLGFVVFSAMPFLGAFVALLSIFWIRWATAQRRAAREHWRTEPLTEIEHVRVGDVVSLLGRVTGPEPTRTPLEHPAVVANLWVDSDYGDEVEHEATWTAQIGQRLELDAEKAELIVESSRLRVFGETTSRVKRLPTRVPDLDDARRKELEDVINNHAGEYGERWLERDVEVVVTARVEDVAAAVSEDRAAGYRGQGRRRRIRLGAPEDGAAVVTSYSPAKVAIMMREAKAQLIGCSIGAVIGAASCVLWYHWLFA